MTQPEFLRRRGYLQSEHSLPSGVVILKVEPEFAEIGRWQFVFMDLSEEDDAIPVLADVDAAGDVELLQIYAADGSGVHRRQVSDQSAEVGVPSPFSERARTL